MLMVQSKPPATMKSSKLKPPPPVPPRPNQNVVAEALAKTRKAVAESKFTKSRPLKDDQKAKTLERTNVAAASTQNTSPKLNGLARVKSFIRDVISDRSSSDDKKLTSNSRRSSIDAISVSTPKSSPEQKSAGKTIKSCRQALVRSLSTSTKPEQESKGRVLKSSSFADKSLPIRKAPPPPLSPKPKLREVKPVSVPKRNSMEIPHKFKFVPSSKPPASPIKESSNDNTTFIVPKSTEAPYATVDEVTEFDNRLSNASDSPEPPNVANTEVDLKKSVTPPPENQEHPSTLERKTSRVTERLISEIIASKNNPKDLKNVIDKGKEVDYDLNLNVTEGVTNFKDMNNHEILIFELQTMRSHTQIPMLEEDTNLNAVIDNEKCSSGRSSASPSIDLSETSELSATVDQNCDNDDPLTSRLRKQFRAISSMSLQGLPPLPKSLSGFAEGPLRDEESDSSVSPEDIAAPGDLDSQLALLKREMASLRRLDLSLLSELWSLNESMASWRQQLERAPRLRPAPPPPPHYLRT